MLIDIAEMYGDGESEKQLIAEALGDRHRQDELFIVSKMYPHNRWSERGVQAACYGSHRFVSAALAGAAERIYRVWFLASSNCGVMGSFVTGA